MSDYVGANLLLDQLAAEGTGFIFGNPGWTVAAIKSALDKRQDIKYILGLHEGIAVSMAAGYAQATGKAGVVNLHAVSGLSNGLASLINAAASRIPLVVTVGQHDSRLLNDLQTGNTQLCQLVNSFAKWSCELKTTEELPRVLRRAFHEAMSPPMGVAVVSLPINLLEQSVVSKIIVPFRTAPLAAADGSFLKRLAGLLVSATKPAVIVGNEIGQYHARKEVVSLVEVLGCPAYCEAQPTTISFPNQHGLFAGVLPDYGQQARDLLKQHDVILICGMQNRTSRDFEEHSFIAPATVVAQINIDSSLAGTSLPCHFGAVGDLAESLAKLRAEVQLLVDTSWVSNSRSRSRQVSGEISQRKSSSQKAPVSDDGKSIPAEMLLSVLDKLKPAKSVLFNDSGSLADLPLSIMKFERSRSYCATNGDLAGYGVSASMGANWADSECTTICLTGDGSFLYYPQALWTAAHYHLNAKIVVFNNQSYSQIQAENGSGSAVSINQPQIELLQMAASMGVACQSVSKPDELEAAVSAMFAAPGPYLLDVVVG